MREQYGSWDAVHESEEYNESGIREIVNGYVGVDCGDWPKPGEKCNTCGVIG